MTTGAVSATHRIVAVLPDVTGVDRSFAYAVPAALAGAVEIGSIVRVPLHGRKVRGWVVGSADEPDGYALREIIGVVSRGPSAELVELGRFGAWRYAGRLRPFLLAGSPRRIVRVLPPAPPARAAAALPVLESSEIAGATLRALAMPSALLRLPPAASRLDVVTEALDWAGSEDTLVLVPARRDAEVLARRLTALDRRVALQPEAWAEAAAGGRRSSDDGIASARSVASAISELPGTGRAAAAPAGGAGGRTRTTRRGEPARRNGRSRPA